jgi:hypothetical protein
VKERLNAPLTSLEVEVPLRAGEASEGPLGLSVGGYNINRVCLGCKEEAYQVMSAVSGLQMERVRGGGMPQQ